MIRAVKTWMRYFIVLVETAVIKCSLVHLPLCLHFNCFSCFVRPLEALPNSSSLGWLAAC